MAEMNSSVSVHLETQGPPKQLPLTPPVKGSVISEDAAPRERILCVVSGGEGELSPSTEMILKMPCFTWTLGSALLLASVVHHKVHPLRNKHNHYNQSLTLLA